ncbi:UNVERIFIED_CONTAM: hypothetical protein GTU68_056700 [Idotea baltica]|nr:hypothetical protein [Idotea baltica]
MSIAQPGRRDRPPSLLQTAPTSTVSSLMTSIAASSGPAGEEKHLAISAVPVLLTAPNPVSAHGLTRLQNAIHREPSRSKNSSALLLENLWPPVHSQDILTLKIADSTMCVWMASLEITDVPLVQFS